MNPKPRNTADTKAKKSDRDSFETGAAEDQQVGTSQAQKGQGQKPSASGKRDRAKK
jgi:hypothetical protein